MFQISANEDQGNLLACPYCLRSHIRMTHSLIHWQAQCSDCQAVGPVARSRQNAQKGWNKLAEQVSFSIGHERFKIRQSMH